MNLNTLRNSVLLGTALLVTGGLLAPGVTAGTEAAMRSDSREVSRLLKEARSSARKLAVTSDEFHSYTRSKLSWRTHVEKAHQIRSQVNTLGATLGKLEEMKAEASPWQQEAIHSMRPMVVELARNTEFVMEHLRGNRQPVGQAEYQDALANKLDLASQLAELTSDFVSYGETKSALDELGTKLEIN